MLVSDSVEVRSATGDVVRRGRGALLVAMDSLARLEGRGAIALQRGDVTSCAGDGFEQGVYTSYHTDAAGSRVATTGSYVITWTVRGADAVVRAVVVDPSGRVRRPPRDLSCLPARADAQRARRVAVAVAPVLTRWSAVSAQRGDLARAGFIRTKSPRAEAGSSDLPAATLPGGAPCEPDYSSMRGINNDLRGELSARVRLGRRFGAEVVSAPVAVEQCTQAYNASTDTRVNQLIRLSDHAALANLLIGNARVGVGLAYARAQLRTLEDSVPASALNRALIRTNGGALGLAAQAAYARPLSPRFYVEAAGRLRVMPTLALDRALHYAPPPLSTTGVALRVGVGRTF